MKKAILSFMRRDEGQDLIEYGLLIGIITVATVASIKLIGPTVAGYFSSLDGLLT